MLSIKYILIDKIFRYVINVINQIFRNVMNLWMPIKPVEILKVEKLQKDFLNRIPELRGENYWQKLKILKMISLQRRQERYRIIYIWKILEGQAPNCGIESTGSDDKRQGRKCKVSLT